MSEDEKLTTQKKPYNPLQKKNLAESIARAILESTPRPLSETDDLGGAGVYIIYYTGDSKLYKPVAAKNKDGQFNQPIYIGKAIPKGGRKGGFADDDSASRGNALRERLGQRRLPGHGLRQQAGLRRQGSREDQIRIHEQARYGPRGWHQQ